MSVLWYKVCVKVLPALSRIEVAPFLTEQRHLVATTCITVTLLPSVQNRIFLNYIFISTKDVMGFFSVQLYLYFREQDVSYFL